MALVPVFMSQLVRMSTVKRNIFAAIPFLVFWFYMKYFLTKIKWS